MIRKGYFVLIFVIFVLGVSTYTFGAKSDPARIPLSTVYFKKDSAVPAPEFANKLKKVRAALKADLSMSLQIEGYARNQGTPAKNHNLAQERAVAVQQWFVKRGVDADRLVIKNSGGSEPAIRKDSPEDTVQSERVDILQVYLKQPTVHFPAVRHEFDPVLEGQEVTHHFIIQNKGDALLEVKKVKTD